MFCNFFHENYYDINLLNSTLSVCPNRNEYCDKLWISIIAETQSYQSDTCNLFKFFAKIIIFFCALKIGGLGVTQGKRIKIIKLIGKT